MWSLTSTPTIFCHFQNWITNSPGISHPSLVLFSFVLKTTRANFSSKASLMYGSWLPYWIFSLIMSFLKSKSANNWKVYWKMKITIHKTFIKVRTVQWVTLDWLFFDGLTKILPKWQCQIDHIRLRIADINQMIITITVRKPAETD